MNRETQYFTKLFNRFSKHYHLIDILSFGSMAYFRKRSLKIINVNTKDKVLDLMCGIGNTIKYLPKQSNYTGVDASDKMLRQARNKYQNKSIQFINADILNPLENNSSFDKVVCCYGIKCLSIVNYPKFMHLISSQLSQNGNFAIVEFQQPINIWLKFIFKFYLFVTLKPFSFLTMGDCQAYHDLIATSDQKINIGYITELAKQNGLSINIKKSIADIFIIISGTKI